MKIPFSTDQFFDVFRNYNETVYPLQAIFYLMSITAIFLIFKPNSKSDKIISGILGFLWIWMGIVYHLIFFTVINKAAYLFGAMFLLQGILFLTIGTFKSNLSFKFRSDIYGFIGLVLILFAIIVYPILGYFLGHVYPVSPTFGLPCPTTIFTLGLLLMSDKKSPISIIIIPFLWSIIGFTATFNFGIIEDAGLLVAGIIALTMFLIKNAKHKNAK